MSPAAPASQQSYPTATGAFSNLLYDIALAAKIIARETTRAGLAEILGLAGKVNVQDEQQMRLDIFADETMIRMNSFTGRISVICGEGEYRRLRGCRKCWGGFRASRAQDQPIPCP